MSNDGVVLAEHRQATKAPPAQWTPLSLLARLIAISALIDAIALIADIARTSASLRYALRPVVVSIAPSVGGSPAGGGLSNAESMKSMGFDHFVRHWLINMDLPLQLLLYVLAACWIYQAVYNVNVRGAAGVGKPGWVVTWFMMPVVNLVSPVFYMSRIWRASIDVRDWEQRRAPALLWAWWLAWVARLGTIRLRVDLNETLEREIHRYKMIIAEDVIWLLSLVLFVIVIYRVSQAQQRQFGR